MKLSEKTVNLLKNFAGINQSILFKKGNKLRTMSVMKNILAEAEVEEEFERFCYLRSRSVPQWCLTLH